jgi:hypothetical protein
MGENLTDLVLISSDGSKFHTCRYVMYHVSEKFRGMFDSQMADSKLGEYSINCSKEVLNSLVTYALTRNLTFPKDILELYVIANEYLFSDIVPAIIHEMIFRYPKMKNNNKLAVINAAITRRHRDLLDLVEPWMSKTEDATEIACIEDMLRSVSKNVKKYKGLPKLAVLFDNVRYKKELEKIIIMAIYHNLPEFWELFSVHSKLSKSIEYWTLESVVICQCVRGQPIPDKMLVNIHNAMKEAINLKELKFD